MALPLKSGADLYNQQALRLRLHNLGADPLSDYGVGQIYFNTSTESDTSKHVRLYDGTAFRSLAYLDEIANNEEFIALKEKVELLSGDVDTDAIISNMKEVAAFLDGFAEDADLMDYLTTELGKKLDKTGGTIKNGSRSNPFNIDTDATDALYMSLQSGGVGKAYLVWNAGQGVYLQDSATNRLGLLPNGTPHYYNGKTNTLIHSDNYSDYALPLTGGTLTGLLSLEYKNPRIAFKSDANTTIGAIGAKDGVLSAYIVADNSWYTLIHSGNIGDYNAGSATKLETERTIWGQSFDGTKNVSGDIILENASILGASNRKALVTSSTDLYIGEGYAAAGHRTFIHGNVIRMYTGTGSQSVFINASGGVTIGSSDLAGTGKYFNVQNVFSVLKRSSDAPASVAHLCVTEIGGSKNGIHMYVDSNSASTKRPFILQYGDNYGNVGIGTDSPTEKLSVVGNITATGEISCGGAGEEGVGGSGASVFQHVFTPSASPSVTILHNLGTEDIVITLYEKDATSGLWSVCLTDIEIVSANEVTVTFGSTSSQEHKVVIMGGVI